MSHLPGPFASQDTQLWVHATKHSVLETFVDTLYKCNFLFDFSEHNNNVYIYDMYDDYFISAKSARRNAKYVQMFCQI